MQSLTVYSDTDTKLNAIKTYVGQRGFDFLKITKSRQIPIDVLVTKERLQEFKNTLRANNISYNITIDDVSEIIHKNKEQTEQQNGKRVRRAPRSRINLESFATYTQIVSYVNFLQSRYGEIVEVFSIGKSYMNVDIIALKISSGTGDKPALLIEGGNHGREWISVSSALYIMQQLIENPRNREIFENIDIFIIPCLNPDGYMYSHQSDSTRLWRKTRSTNRFSLCRGTDANRNFDIQWGYGEASVDPCSEIYIGREAFSEAETKAFRDFVLPLQDKITTYVSLHSYAGFILYPWSFTNISPPNLRRLNCVARRVRTAMARVSGITYPIGNSHDLLYPTSGDSMDWVAAHTRINLSFTIEISGGDYGFLPGIQHIIPTGNKIFEAIKVFAQSVDGRICNIN
ncbi:PREDICTED: carboxypeptidase B-like [Ceratosolen solmsi marchali]|uniref:Carboxypeptidase B-like n=1 Tax=Ceratosolen solmsi marchali TaxID=326594 RepID=A0AAJ6YWL4_9HYME|nr:PREDICTED: carboxypeptidase B-like [Ceratosolen solmsi marchali]